MSHRSQITQEKLMDSELVSQNTTVYSSSKRFSPCTGSAALFLSATNATYSGEQIETGDGSTVDFTGTLAHLPVKAGTLTITYTDTTGKTITDDGLGALEGDVAADTNTITYATGEYSFRCSGAPDNGTAVYAAYTHADGSLTVSQQCSNNGTDWYDPKDTAGSALGVICSAQGPTTGVYIAFSPVVAHYSRLKVVEGDAGDIYVTMKLLYRLEV